jgi:NAD(P)-dependent dehydrogenase (short-subunit alcohol dehydrogenase family)
MTMSEGSRSELNGKVAVITGGSRGLGYAIAQAFATAGASVVIGARSQAAVEKAAAEMVAQGRRAAGFAMDVGRREQVEALAEHAVHAFGRIDVWVNNAGTAGPYGPTMEMAPAAFEQVVNTNILGTYYGSHAAMCRFLAQGSGKLINLLGHGWKGPVPFQNPYSASKAWVRSFTMALAEETKQAGAGGIGVFAFNPGMVLTELLTDVEVIEGSEARLERFPAIVRMWAKPPEVPAAKAVWIASAATDGKTGLIYNIFTPANMLSGAVRAGARRLAGRHTDTAANVTIHSIAAHH